MDVHNSIALLLDPSRILLAQGLSPDPWQRALLFAPERQLLLNCSRQSGKSTTVSALALHTALFTPGGLVLLLSPSQRQSGEIFRKVLLAYRALGRPLKALQETQTVLELENRSRIICLPGREGTIRSFSGVNLLVLDEAARIPDDLYRSVRPMLAVSRGRLVALSTPFGQHGWFYEEWHGNGPWKRVRITWRDCPRITPEFIAEESRALGLHWVDQEYNACFTALEGLVYPDFEAALVDDLPPPLTPNPSPLSTGERGAGRRVGGIDFGWRNPFAALWGVLDQDDVLWLEGERYRRETPLHEHATALRALGSVQWYADPAGRTETEELRAANLNVRRGDNDIRLGIAAVTARLRTGRLKVPRSRCPQLLAEAKLYRYPTAAERKHHGEEPIDAHNHALAALRYLIAKLDARFVARLRKPALPANHRETVSSSKSLDLWELTTLYQEVQGSTYWFLDRGLLGVPQAIWILPSQNVTPRREPNSRNLVDYYSYRTGTTEQRFPPDQIIAFRYPDPRDPYTSGLSPLRACYEQVCLTSQYAAFKQEKFDFHAIPDAIVSPDEVIGEEERDRLETQWQSRFRQGGGKVVVADSALRVQLLNHSMGDLAALADMNATRQEIANAFHVPLSFLTSETNLANLQAAEHQHMAKAISPRLKRRDEKLNEQLVPLFDPSGRLFLASEDPVPINREMDAQEQELNLKYGVVTINEVRSESGLPPVPWGDTPWVPQPSSEPTA